MTQDSSSVIESLANSEPVRQAMLLLATTVAAAAAGALTGGIASPAALALATRVLASRGLAAGVAGAAARQGALLGAPVGILEQFAPGLLNVIPGVPIRPRSPVQRERDTALRQLAKAGLQPRVRTGANKGQLRRLNKNDREAILASKQLSKRTKDIVLLRGSTRRT